jgi:hypothetical protein
MAYTPELSYRGSATLRRLSWFTGDETYEILLLSPRPPGILTSKINLGVQYV